MARCRAYFSMAMLLLLVSVAVATPPGIANNPSHATCKNQQFKECYNLPHVCPKFCPDQCHVDCASCKPICGAAPPDSPDSGYSPSPPDDGRSPNPPTPYYPPPTQSPPPSSPAPPTSTPYSPPLPSSSPPPQTPPPSSPPPQTPPPSSPPPQTPPPSSPPPQTPPPAPPTLTPPPTTSPSSPPTLTPPPTTPPSSQPPSFPPTPTSLPTTPPSSPPTSSPPTLTPPPTTPPSSPSPQPPTLAPSPPPTPTTPPSTPPTKSLPPPSNESEDSGQTRGRCKNRNYPQCYNTEHVCPSSCPGGCEVDCVSCKPVCKCDRPGAVCQDPRFVGGDGITFYFHGKKDRDFCLLSDDNLHINGHFIGRRNQNMKRDFTWVQSIGVLFDKHQLFMGALKTSTWDDAVDRLAIYFNGEPVTLPASEGASWKSTSVPSVSVVRTADANSVNVEVQGMFRITAKVVPISEQDSIVHNYGITKDDCFAHLDLGFKFFSLSNEVSGVLGQTYRPGYVSRVKIGAAMPVMGGDKEFRSSSMFSTDCPVARFAANKDSYIKIPEDAMTGLELPALTCGSGIGGRGVVCKR